MLNYLYNVSIIFGIMFAMFLCPFNLCKGVIKMEKGSTYKLTFKEVLICILPVVNIAMAGWIYKRDWILGLLCTTSVASLMFRMYMIFSRPEDARMQVYSLYAMLAFTFVYWIYLMISIYIILVDSDIVVGLNLVIMSVIFPIGQYYIGSFLVKSMEFNQDREDTFKWQD